MFSRAGYIQGWMEDAGGERYGKLWEGESDGGRERKSDDNRAHRKLFWAWFGS
jgi:hypothetical protein